ncbi:glycosyltransferase family 32 protein [Chitinophagaceae bacterium MMS25-I14]
MHIPRVIHQTWKTSDVPDDMRQMAVTWQQNHHGWKYMLWTDEMNRRFVATHFPEYLSIYDRFPAAIQRVDAVRYMILYKLGGIFVDLDFECLRNIMPLLEGHICVFGREPDAHCSIHNKKQIISNAFMASVPGHDFFYAILEEIKSGPQITSHRFDRVLESTGPFMLTRVYEKSGRKEDITILPSELLYPLTKQQLENHERPDNTAYALHHYHGTWWKPFL